MKTITACLALAAAICVAGPWSGASANSYKYRVLYSFCSEGGCTDGVRPAATLLVDQSGNLYGTTQGGGALGDGTVFRLSPRGHNKWKHTTLYSFCSQSATCSLSGSSASVVIDTSGNLYGTTGPASGTDGGLIFSLKPKQRGEWKYTQVYAFPCSGGVCPNGSNPSGLTYLGASSGQPYDGTSALFGAGNGGGGGLGSGGGVAFRLEPQNNRWRQTVLYNFCTAISGDCADGAGPNTAVMDSAGRLWGTTSSGGDDRGGGVLYSITGRHESVEYEFCSVTEDCPDGGFPMSPVFLDNFGRILGTTPSGGANGPIGDGTLWTVSGGNEQVLHNFCAKANCADGENPSAGVIEDSAGTIFGVAPNGGDDNGGGVLFEFRNGALHVLHTFSSGSDGCTPIGGLIMDASGNIYGTTSTCGAGGGGTVFELSPK